jgi:hypothetical protein
VSQIVDREQGPHGESHEELAAGFALGALDPADHQVFLEVLEGCRRCQALVDEYLAVAASLPEALEEMTRLRASVRASSPRPARIPRHEVV